MKLPRYYILGKRPVKIVETENGGMGAYGLNLETGEFELNMLYYLRVTKADNENAVRVSEEEFFARVEELRKEIDVKKSA